MFGRHSFFLLSLLISVATPSYGHAQAKPQKCGVGCQSIPALQKSLLKINSHRHRELDPTHVEVLVWNVYKGQKIGWSHDFEQATLNADLVLVQEALLNVRMEVAFSEVVGRGFKMAVSFITSKGLPTGVATGSEVRPLSTRVVRSKGKEPVSDTPKTTLVQTFELKSRKETLMVINTHALNFSWVKPLEAQLSELRAQMTQHKGPMIFAGDFNTWNGARRKALQTFTKGLGLTEVKWPKDPRSLVLDYVFVRGGKVVKAEVLRQYKASDHHPLWVQLDLGRTDSRPTQKVSK